MTLITRCLAPAVCSLLLCGVPQAQSASESSPAASRPSEPPQTLGSLLDEVEAGYDRHFFIRDREGKFLLEFAALAQFRYLATVRDQESDEGEFEIATLRPIFKGHAGSERLHYLVQADFKRDGEDLTLLDWVMSYDLDDDWTLSGGQFRLPFSREQLIGRAVQLGVDRSVVNFVLDLGAVGGRSQGLQLEWSPARWRALMAFSDGVDGVSTAFPGASSNWALTGRIESVLVGERPQFSDLTSPEGSAFGLQVGASVHAEENLFAVTADVHAEWSRSVAFVQLTQFEFDASASQLERRLRGAVGQVGVRATEQVEAFARFEYGDSDLESDSLRLAIVGSNYYFEGQRSKLSAEVGVALDSVTSTWAASPLGLLSDRPGEDGQVVFRLQHQFSF